MNEENKVMNAIVNLMVCPRHPGSACCAKCSYKGVESCYEQLVGDSMTALNKQFCGQKPVVGSQEPDYELMIVEHLRALGVPANLVGYRYLKCAIRLVLDKPGYIDTITCGLYPAVSKLNGTTPSRVERGIRHAIEVSWQRGDLEELHKYFGCVTSSSKGKPTNSEFIAAVAERIRLDSRSSSK